MKATKDVDVVVHAAAAASALVCRRDYQHQCWGYPHYVGSRSKTNVRRFIYISSTAVYGVPKKASHCWDGPSGGSWPVWNQQNCRWRFVLCSNWQADASHHYSPKTFVGTERLGVLKFCSTGCMMVKIPVMVTVPIGTSCLMLMIWLKQFSICKSESSPETI